MAYWLNLFTGTTWAEFQKAGSQLSGFRENNWARAGKIKAGDIFLCYLVGVSRWVGLLEITGERFRDESRIFGEELFPVRFPVKPLVALPPEHGVLMEAMRGKLSFFPQNGTARKWSGYVRNSPSRYADDDGNAIAKAIRDAAANPINHPVDAKQLSRSANLYKTRIKTAEGEVVRVISIPPADEEPDNTPILAEVAEGPTHTEIQWRLLDLGSQMGLEVWAPKRDRGRTWSGYRIGEVARLRDRLPSQFDENANRIIE